MKAVAALGLALLACHGPSGQGASPSPSPSGYVYPVLGSPLERLGSVDLRVLPESATYSWVGPASVFRRTFEVDSLAMHTPEGRSIRSSVETVLRGSAWREVPQGAGEFEVTAWVYRRKAFGPRSVATVIEQLVVGIRRVDGRGVDWRLPYDDPERTGNVVAGEILRLILLRTQKP